MRNARIGKGYHIWTPEEEALLKESIFEKTPINTLVEVMGISKGSIYGKRRRIMDSMSTEEERKSRRRIANRKNQASPKWTESEIEYLLANYNKKNRRAIASKLNRSTNAVDGKYRSLSLRGVTFVQLPIDFKKKEETPVEQSNKRRCLRWSRKDLKYLKDNVKTMSFKEIGKELQRSEAAVSYKYYELKRNKKLDKKEIKSSQETTTTKNKLSIKNIILASLITINILCVISVLLHLLK